MKLSNVILTLGLLLAVLTIAGSCEKRNKYRYITLPPVHDTVYVDKPCNCCEYHPRCRHH